MCTELKLLDTLLFRDKILKNGALECSEDGRYCITSEKGIYLLHFCPDMGSLFPRINLTRSYIVLDKFLVSDSVGIELNNFMQRLPRFKLYEAMLRQEVCGNMIPANPIEQRPIYAKWSPAGVVTNVHSMIAVLTNTGSLCLYVRSISPEAVEQFHCVANVSLQHIEIMKENWSKTLNINVVANLNEFIRRVEMCTPTALTWSHLLEKGGSKFCLLIVGYLNGDVRMWKVHQKASNDISETKLILFGEVNTGLKKITALHWQPSELCGVLMIGDLEGTITAVTVEDVTQTRLTVSDLLCLWKEEDGVNVEFFRSILCEEDVFVCAVKGSFLIIFLMARSGEILDKYAFQAENYFITGVEHLSDGTILVLTYTGVLKELRLSIVAGKIDIKFRNLNINIDWTSYRTHGLVISPNKVFLVVLVSMSKLAWVRRNKSNTKVFVFMNMARNPLTVLLQNPTRSMFLFWDCLETLRLNGLLEKKLPCTGMPSENNYGKLRLVKLRAYLWLARSSETLQEKMYTITSHNILKSHEFKAIISLKVVLNHMKRLLTLYSKNSDAVSAFHLQSLDVLNGYLNEVVADDLILRFGLGEDVIDDVYQAMMLANELSYPLPPTCFLCQEKLIGSCCIPYHIDNRCTISLMQIQSHPYYQCAFCSSSVHPKMLEIYETLLCPFCDVALDLVSPIDNNNQLSVNINGKSKKLDCPLCALEEEEGIKDDSDLESRATGDDISEEFELMRVSDEENHGDFDEEDMPESFFVAIPESRVTEEYAAGKRKRSISDKTSESELTDGCKQASKGDSTKGTQKRRGGCSQKVVD